MLSGNQRRVSVRKLGIVLVFVICGLVSTDYTDLSGHTKTLNPDSDDCGRCVLDEALQALGGENQLQQLASITMKGVGEQHASAESQGYASAQQSTEAYAETLVAFPSREKLAFEHRTDKGGQNVRWRRWLYDGQDRNVGDFLAQAKFTRRNPSVANERVKISRRIPHMLLLEANRSSSKQDLGAAPTQYDGRQHNIISFTPAGEKTALKLFFDARTNLLSKFEYQIDFPTLGDTLIEYTYAGYRQDPLLGWAPTRHTIKVAGNEAMAVNVVMTANTPEANEIFKLPEFPQQTAEETFQLPENLRSLVGRSEDIVTAAEGVNVMEVGSFTVMFVEFKDFIMAVEAPASHPSITSIPADNQRGSTALAEESIRRMKERIPNKPIKYLVVTHYHSDHSGGARAFIAEGATILTTPGNKRFFEKMASASNTLVADRLSRSPRTAKIETIARRRVVTDGARKVELINVGPNPHTEESLVLYAPREKILFQGDLFYFDLGAPFPPKNRIPIMSFFAKWLKQNQLAPERIYSVHSHGFATMDHVNKVLARSASNHAQKNDSTSRYLFYLHGRIVENGRRPNSPQYGFYEYDQILDTFKKRGFLVMSEQRPKGTEVEEYAKKIAAQISILMKTGVSPRHITVVGASQGSFIAMLVSTYLKNRDLNFVFIAGCSANAADMLKLVDLHGNVLSIYEQSDVAGTCEHYRADATGIGEYEETQLRTGLRHGFIYRPMIEWVDPTVAWAKKF